MKRVTKRDESIHGHKLDRQSSQRGGSTATELSKSTQYASGLNESGCAMKREKVGWTETERSAIGGV